MDNQITRIQRIRNYVIERLGGKPGPSSPLSQAGTPYVQKRAQSVQSYIAPLQLERITHDIALWREAIRLAEQSMYPSRVKMQRMYVDTILEGHTISCMDRRRKLSSLKDFIIVDANKNINEDATAIFCDQPWFDQLVKYILDAQFYGYSLIQLGDLEVVGKDYNFPQLTTIRRWNVEPDRQNLVSIPYQKQGINFLDPSEKDEEGNSYYDWTIYIDTPSDNGHSICGYGLLYSVAMYGIILKNNLGNNADYTQSFSTPYRHAKTPMSLDEEKRSMLETALAEMGAMGYVITDDGITIDFHEANSGNGYKGYESLEQRCEKKISKLLLGHGDAMDSTPGKLGSGQGKEFDETAVGSALKDVEKEQDKFLLQNLNRVVLPKLRKLGFPVPKDCRFDVSRDREAFEARCKEDQANKGLADIYQTIKNAGGKPDWKYFTDRTGIPVEEIQEQEVVPGNPQSIANKLNRIYASH